MKEFCLVCLLITAAIGLVRYVACTQALQESNNRLNGQVEHAKNQGWNTEVVNQPVRWLEAEDMNRINKVSQ